MRFLIITTSRRHAWRNALADTIAANCDDASVSFLAADPRLANSAQGALVPPSELDSGLRWGDLVMVLGWRRAAWAALPWVLESASSDGGDGSAEGATVVLDDTFAVLGDLNTTSVGDLAVANDRVGALSKWLDPVSGGWGGAASGMLVAPTEPGWRGWWKRRTVERIRNETPRSGLPADAVVFGDAELCLSARSLTQLPPDCEPNLADFAGLDPRVPAWIDDSGQPIDMCESEVLERVTSEQARRMLAAGWTDSEETELSLVAGLEFSDNLRSWYGSLLANDPPVAVPNPLVEGEVQGFMDLLSGPGDTHGSGTSVAADLVLEERPDLLDAFPHVRWQDKPAFNRWLWSHGLAEGVSPLLVLPDPATSAAPDVGVTAGDRVRPFGVNLIGYLHADLGLGVSARRLKGALESAGVPVSEVSYDGTTSNQSRPQQSESATPYHFNLMVITPDQLPLFVEDVGAKMLAGHHNIGYWYWESDVVAPQQMEAFDLVDEVWTATEYVASAFRSAELLPVTVMPSPLVFESTTGWNRSSLGLDDRFTFLFSFDFLSVMERKNPRGVVEAYVEAFPSQDGTRLILKSINGHLFPDEHRTLLEAIHDRPDIELWDRLLSATDRLGLIEAADCYVSLHRSEGLGLTLAEAMALGTPVIASRYSGNLDFMNDSSGLLVDVEEVRVGKGQYYPEDGHWAQPDLLQAADMMRRIVADPGLRTQLAAEGKSALEEFSFEAVGQRAKSILIDRWRSASNG